MSFKLPRPKFAQSLLTYCAKHSGGETQEGGLGLCVDSRSGVGLEKGGLRLKREEGHAAERESESAQTKTKTKTPRPGIEPGFPA